MYRTIFIPSEQNPIIPFVIPNEWYGQKVEVLVFPVYGTEEPIKQELSVPERRKSREELNELLDKYPIDLSGFKFNRDEANDYD